MTALYFTIALGILILVHEWGHFFVARRSGIRVDEFSIGFGPKLFSWKPGPTEFKLCLFPLGGYVKLYGEDPVAEAEGDEARAREIAADPGAFSGSSLRARLLTVFAGPFMNIVLCFLLMPVVFMIGKKIPAYMNSAPVVVGVFHDSPALRAGILEGDRLLSIASKPMATWKDVMQEVVLNPDKTLAVEIERGGSHQTLAVAIENQNEKQPVGFAGFEPALFIQNDPIVDEVSKDGPADMAGFEAGDLITSVDGHLVKTWTAMTRLIRASRGAELSVGVARAGQDLTLLVTPSYNPEQDAYLMGITRKITEVPMAVERFGFGSAIVRGAKENWQLLSLTCQVLGRVISADMSVKTLGGPVQIFSATGAAARSGIADFLYFVSFLSLQLGFLNLLPIPVLDGGHVLFMAIEGIMRKPLPAKLRSGLSYLGLSFLLGMMVLVTYNDLDRMWNISKWVTKFLQLF